MSAIADRREEAQRRRLETVQEYFKRLLGRQELDNGIRAEIYTIMDLVRLPETDPFWAVIAYIYARLPRDQADYQKLVHLHETLETYKERLDGFGETLSGAVASLEQHIDARLGTPQNIDLDAIETRMRTALGGLQPTVTAAPRPSFREWLGDHVRHLTFGALAVMALLVTAPIGGYLLGAHSAAQDYDARLKMVQGQATGIARWALSDEGRATYQWARLNRGDLRQILTCGWKGAATREESGYTACFPAGHGNGYYIVR